MTSIKRRQNDADLEPPLDITRPFMDDKRCPISDAVRRAVERPRRPAGSSWWPVAGGRPAKLNGWRPVGVDVLVWQRGDSLDLAGGNEEVSILSPA